MCETIFFRHPFSDLHEHGLQLSIDDINEFIKSIVGIMCWIKNGSWLLFINTFVFAPVIKMLCSSYHCGSHNSACEELLLGDHQ